MSHIEVTLEPLRKYLNRKGLLELHADEFGKLFLYLAGEGRRLALAPELDKEFWWNLAHAIANAANIVDLERKPYIRAALEGKGGNPIRLTLCLGSTIESGIMAAARILTPGKFTINDFGLDKDGLAQIEKAVVEKWNIIICGGMNSGKTSFLNACAKLVPPSDRLVTIQDVNELSLDHIESKVNFVINPLSADHDVTNKDILDAITRASPQRIWLGEANIDNTWLLLRTLNMGHGGQIGTIHANNTRLALAALAMNCEFQKYDRDASAHLFQSTIQMFIHIERDRHNIPRVRDIWIPEEAHDGTQH